MMTGSLETTVISQPDTHPPYPRTERQAEFIDLGNRMAKIAAEQADEHDRNNTFPHDTFDALRESGYLKLTVPEEFGGRGANALELMLAQEHLARGSGAVALGATMHLGIVGGLAESRAWPPELLERFFHEVVNDGALINSAASEPDLGSPSRGGAFQTTAVREGDSWKINGRKTWTTLSPGLSYAQVQLTIVEDNGERSRGIFLVPMTTPGVRVEDTWDNASMRASGSNDVDFNDVIVPDAFRLPAPSGPPKPQASSWSLIGSAVYLGIAQAARDFAVQFAKERVPSGLGKPIAELETVQHRVAMLDILLLQSRSVLYSTAEVWQEYPHLRDAISWQFAAAKYTVTNHAIQITDGALRVVGSAGLQKKYPLERYFRDARAGLGNPPMDDVALTSIGKHALDVD